MNNGNPIEISAITPRIGAEIKGLDLGQFSDTQDAFVREAFRRHLVLVFRDQELTREQHKSSGRLSGELQTHPAKTHLGLPGDPEIFDIRITGKSRFANGELWHTDLSCEPVPPSGGVDTLFASMHEAFTEKINELGSRESAAIPDLLYRHIEAGVRFHCRVQWQPKTLVLWDNRAVHHHAVWDYFPESRRGERVTAKCQTAPVPFRAQ